MLEETVTKYSDKVAAFHFCMFSLFILRISDIQINIDYIVTILKYLADEGNIYACAKLAVFRDLRQDYMPAFIYMSKAESFMMPLTLANTGSYSCTIKHPVKALDLNRASEYWKKASYFGQSIRIEYLKLLDINKDHERLFTLANFCYLSELFGCEIIIGECYEKGKGVEKNLKKSLFDYTAMKI